MPRLPAMEGGTGVTSVRLQETEMRPRTGGGDYIARVNSS
jgi:hypothetical protein